MLEPLNRKKQRSCSSSSRDYILSLMSSPHYKGIIDSESVREENGKITIQPRALGIIWGMDQRYWRIPKEGGIPAELLQVSWLEVSGSIDLSSGSPQLTKGMEYKVSFEVSLKPDAFGWADSPVFLMAKPGKGRYIWKSADLNGKKPLEPFFIPVNSVLKFTVPDDGGKLLFGMYEIWKGRWKGGLLIHRVVIERYTPNA